MTVPNVPHQQLVERAVRGDDAALTELVTLYHDRVYRYGRAVCRDTDIDDAVQEAFLALVKSRETLTAGNGIASWLFTTVRNACRQMLRPIARRRQRLGQQVDSAELEDVADQNGNPEAVALRNELVQSVYRGLASLDAQQREILVLRDLEGFTGEQTAERLGLSLPAMKSRLRRARLSLRKALS